MGSPEVRCQKSDVRCQMSDVRCQMSEVRSQMSDICLLSSVLCPLASGKRPIRVSADGGEAAARLWAQESDVRNQKSDYLSSVLCPLSSGDSCPQNIISAPPTSSLHFYLSAENGRPDKLFDELTRFCTLSKYLKSTIRRHCSQQSQGNNHYVGKTHKSGKSNKYGVFRRHNDYDFCQEGAFHA